MSHNQRMVKRIVLVLVGLVVLAIAAAFIFFPTWTHQQCMGLTHAREFCTALIPLDRLNSE